MHGEAFMYNLTFSLLNAAIDSSYVISVDHDQTVQMVCTVHFSVSASFYAPSKRWVYRSVKITLDLAIFA
jgi:hypothetical protein